MSEEKDKGGRPFKDVDWRMVEELCQLQCTKPEIVGVLGFSEDTLERAIKREYGIGYAEYYAQNSAGGKVSLRRRQRRLADEGNAALCIWLGKQWLNQKEPDRDQLRDSNTLADDIYNHLGKMVSDK